MYDKSVEWLIYSPPKSGGFGHQSRIRNARKAWDLTQKFLKEFTTFELFPKYELSVYGLDKSLDLKILEKRIEVARDLFGSEIGPPQYNHTWQVPRNLLEVAIEFALDDDMFSKMTHGPTSLYFSYDFVWPEFSTTTFVGKTLGDFNGLHDGISSLGVYIGEQRVFLQPHFIFPDSWQSSTVLELLNKIDLHVPFRFRDQYFKRSLPSAKPRKYGRGRTYNLSKEWRTEIKK